jgi:ABC-type Na+ efflux pump permease subunit
LGKEQTMMRRAQSRTPSGLRILLAIAWKDIIDPLKSMTTVSVIIGTMVLILSSQAVPLLLGRSDALSLVVYDPGETGLVAALLASDGVQVAQVDSIQELHAGVVESPLKRIGVPLPVDIDEALRSGDAASLEGHVAWANRRQAADLAERLEREIAATSGGTGEVAVEVRLVYPDPESSGSWGLFQGSVVLQLLIVGVYVVSYLIFDEKEAKTLDALLVSPASATHIVAGKVIAGALYCAAAAWAALILGWPSVVHWDVLLASTAAISLVAVSLGLLAGVMFDNAQQMGLWFVVPMLVLVVGVMAKAIASRLPPVVAVLVRLLPTAAASEAMQLAAAGEVSLVDALPQLGIVLAWGLLAFGAAVVLVRRMDR